MVVLENKYHLRFRDWDISTQLEFSFFASSRLSVNNSPLIVVSFRIRVYSFFWKMPKYNWINSKGNHGYKRVSNGSKRGTYTYINRSGDKISKVNSQLLLAFCWSSKQDFNMNFNLILFCIFSFSYFRDKNSLQTKSWWFHDAQMDILWARKYCSY